jgi:hypothetical protein
MEISEYTKSELAEIASWYGVDLPLSMKKSDMIQNVEVLLNKKENQNPNLDVDQEIQLSVRIRRIKESNNETRRSY